MNATTEGIYTLSMCVLETKVSKTWQVVNKINFQFPCMFTYYLMACTMEFCGILLKW